MPEAKTRPVADQQPPMISGMIEGGSGFNAAGDQEMIRDPAAGRLTNGGGLCRAVATIAMPVARAAVR